jgi:hypothetical protein
MKVQKVVKSFCLGFGCGLDLFRKGNGEHGGSTLESLLREVEWKG